MTLIEIGRIYKVQIGRKPATVRVLEIREFRGLPRDDPTSDPRRIKAETHYAVIDLSTGRRHVFRSSSRFEQAPERPVPPRKKAKRRKAPPPRKNLPPFHCQSCERPFAECRCR